jgi:hypothetical protein
MAGQFIRRGENMWCVRVFTGRDAHGKGSYINQTVHGTKREADQELRKLLAQRDTGRLHVKPKQSVNDYLDVWLETVVRPSVRQRTLHGYDETLRLYVRPNLGRLRLTSVTPIEVPAMLVKFGIAGWARGPCGRPTRCCVTRSSRRWRIA